MQEKLTIDRLSDGGAGVGRCADGKTAFVSGTAPGDVALVAFEEDKPSWRRGSLLEVVEPSPLRVEPACGCVGACGGCSWQHVAYGAQLEAKRGIVADALQRIAGIGAERAQKLTLPTLPCKSQLGYRNKLELGAHTDEGGQLHLGFRRSGSHVQATPDSCLLAPSAIAGAAKALRGALRFAQGRSDLRLHRVGVRHSQRTGQTEVALWTEPGACDRSRLAAVVGDALDTSSIVRVLAPSGKARAASKVEALAGRGCWKERLAGLSFFTSAPSFFQINTEQAEALVAEALEQLQAGPGQQVADLYAGGGTFTLPLAKAGACVTAVESVGFSVRDLRRNCEANGLEAEIRGGDVERVLPSLGKLDALIVDPPRSGLKPGVVAAIAQASPSRFVYVSCNPATWARDAQRLEAAGYTLQKVQPVDHFPQTHHIELVSLFTC